MIFDLNTFLLGTVNGLVLGGVLFKLIPLLARAYFSLMTPAGREEQRQIAQVRSKISPQESFRDQWIAKGKADREQGLPPISPTTAWVKEYYDLGYNSTTRAAA